jgi:hypothetical protein
VPPRNIPDKTTLFSLQLYVPITEEIMPTILAIEASAEACSVALASGGRTFSRSLSEARSHSQSVLPMVDALMAEAELDWAKFCARSCIRVE